MRNYSGLVSPRIAGVIATVIWPSLSAAQAAPAPASVLTLAAAITYAMDHYPAVRASLEQLSAARAGVSLARTQYLPQLSALYQDGRATQNQVLGVWLPTPYNAAVEGPLGAPSAQSFWNSQAEALFSWEPLDLGLRSARVDEARSALARSEASLALTRLQVAAAVGNAFLATAGNQRTVAAASANVDRWQAFATTVHTLVDNQLRPGADAARADAQLAQAKTQFYQAQAAEQAELATLAALMGAAGSVITVDTAALLTQLPVDSLPNVGPGLSPIAQDQAALVRQTEAQRSVLSHSDLPRLFLQAEGFARGSDVPTNGAIVGSADGLFPGRANWVAGVTVAFPDVFSFRALSVERRIAAANERAQRATYDRTLQDVTGQIQAARAELTAARLVADETPIELTAARQSETQSRARYQSGLATIVEVADAEGLLAQAEVADAVARLNVWRGLFGVAYAQGDLQDFLALVTNPSGGGR